MVLSGICVAALVGGIMHGIMHKIVCSPASGRYFAGETGK